MNNRCKQEEQNLSMKNLRNNKPIDLKETGNAKEDYNHKEKT